MIRIFPTPTVHISAAILAFLMLLAPLPVNAAAPAPVGGLSAERTETGVHVTWDAVPNAARYIIFYSRSSILQNAGAYEDFAIAPGNATSADLSMLPSGGSVYVAVLAENAEGEDSGVFAEEAVVSLGDAPSPHLSGSSTSAIASSASSSAVNTEVSSSVASEESASSASSSAEEEPIPDTRTLRVLTVRPVDATNVEILFSAPVVIADQDAPFAFAIHDARGTPVTLQRLRVEGTRVTIATERLAGGSIYVLTVNAVVRGKVMEDGAEILLPTDPSTARILFTGMGALETDPELKGMDVRDLTLKAMADDRGTMVEASWTPPERLDLVATYLVSQSADGGKTFAAPQQVARTARMVRFPGVGVKNFAIRIQVKTVDDQKTDGVIAPITLLGGLEGSVLPKPPTNGSASSSSRPSMPSPGDSGLPSSGAPIAAAAGIAGVGGWMAWWRRAARRS